MLSMPGLCLGPLKLQPFCTPRYCVSVDQERSASDSSLRKCVCVGVRNSRIPSVLVVCRAVSVVGSGGSGGDAMVRLVSAIGALGKSRFRLW